jgi:Bromodomain
MSMSDRETSARLLNVMSTLYCQPFAVDFRKPVEILYPNIASDYLSIIKHPMDLGTLLLECMKGTATVKSTRDGLKQIFSNSVRFNVDAPMIEATSRHLESFAVGLFEENTKALFNDKVSVAEDFRIVLTRKRTARLLTVSKSALRVTDIRFLENCILNVPENIPRELMVAVENIKNVLQNFLQLYDSQSEDSPAPPVLTIERIFLQLLECSRSLNPITTNNDGRSRSVLQPSLAVLLSPQMPSTSTTSTDSAAMNTYAHLDTDSSPSNIPFNAVSERLRIKSLSKTTLLPSVLAYLNALDDLLGFLFVKLEERLLRGTNRSSVWQRPYGIVWAPQNKVRKK